MTAHEQIAELARLRALQDGALNRGDISEAMRLNREIITLTKRMERT